MSENKKFEFESYQDPASIREQLSSILDGMEKGRILLATEGQEILLTPGPLLKVSIKAKRKDGENRMTLRITWKDARREETPAGKSILIRS